MSSVLAAFPRRLARLTMTRTDGPAQEALAGVAARTVCLLRCMAVGYTVLVAGIWYSTSWSDPWMALGVAVAVVWDLCVVWHLAASGSAGRRLPLPWLAVADLAVHVALALGASLWVPQALLGDASNWLFVLVIGQFPLQLWCVSRSLGLPLVLVGLGSYRVGERLARSMAADRRVEEAPWMLLIASVVLALAAHELLRRWAQRADDAFAKTDANERAEFVALARARERREYERLLHDTVLNTLTALTRMSNDGDDAAVERCRHDVRLIERALGGADDMFETGAAPEPDGGLRAGIEAVAEQMRASGLVIHLMAGGDADGLASVGGAEVPPRVAAALVWAAREALANVSRHAGTREAWVDVRLSGGVTAERLPADGQVHDGPTNDEPTNDESTHHGPIHDGSTHDGSKHDCVNADSLEGPISAGRTSGGVTVVVRDVGAGFHIARVRPSRLGIRRSIVERVEDCGGEASVTSAPGAGTVVTLRWPKLGPPLGQPHPQPGAGRPRRALVGARRG